MREALEDSSDAGMYVRQLEEQYDTERPGQATSMLSADDADDLPSPGELLDDLERFLRDQQKPNQ